MIRSNLTFLPNLIMATQLARSVTEEQPVLLPKNFTPGEFDVICGRGRQCYAHNERFRALVADRLHEYSSAPSKPEKSRIVTTIYEEILSKGDFVRKDNKANRWVSVPELAAREKISQSFRDELTDQYQSSKDCRQRKRKQTREELHCVFKDDDEEEIRTAKRARAVPLYVRSSPLQPLKTSEALDQLLKFSSDISKHYWSQQPEACSSSSFPEEPLSAEVDSKQPPEGEKKTCTKRFSLSDISLGYEDLTLFPALSA